MNLIKYNFTRCLKRSYDEHYSVIFRVTYHGEKEELYSGVTVHKKDWDYKKNQVKQGCKVNGYYYNILNCYLRTLENFIDNYFIDHQLHGSPATLSKLKERFYNEVKR